MAREAGMGDTNLHSQQVDQVEPEAGQIEEHRLCLKVDEEVDVGSRRILTAISRN